MKESLMKQVCVWMQFNKKSVQYTTTDKDREERFHSAVDELSLFAR